MTSVPMEVDAFVHAASRLSVDALDAIRRAVAAATAAGTRDGDAVPKLSASEFSVLDKRVRDAFVPRHDELRAGRPGGLRSAIAYTTTAARAIWKPEQLPPAQYHALVDPFADVGITVPKHPDDA